MLNLTFITVHCEKENICVWHTKGHTSFIKSHTSLVRTLHYHIFQHAMLLSNVSKSPGDFCVWHPESIEWYSICVSQSADSPWEKVYPLRMCIYIYSNVWVHLSVHRHICLSGLIFSTWSQSLDECVCIHRDLHPLQCFPQSPAAHKH